MNSLCQHVHLRQRKSEIQFIFKALDKNNDSELTAEELVSGYSKIIGLEKAKAHVKNIMKMVDINNDKKISYTKFVLASLNRMKFLTNNRPR